MDNIITIPSDLESTSLVFAYGHDLFFTKIQPDNTFDLLGEEFSYVLLIISVCIAFVGAFTLRYFAKKTKIEKYFFI